MSFKILIDAGHGGKDKGGGSNAHFLEKDMNLKISLYQYKRCQELGINAELTRDKDIYLNSNKRSSIVKFSGADLCISNHINAGGGQGFEAIHSIHGNGQLAHKIANDIKETGHKVRRVFCKKNKNGADYYYMHRLTGKVQTIIIEYGFADNKADTELLLNNWQEYAESVLRSICLFYNINYQEPKQKSPQANHWALKEYNYLNDLGLDIKEQRFDDNITRGEAFALIRKYHEAMFKF